MTDSAESVDWLGLPEPVRERIAELAAAALGKLPSDDVPRQLRPVARFAPAKRARLGGPALLAALRDSGRFRTAVLEWLREHRVDALNPNDDDSVAAAAAAVLLGESSASSRVRLVARNTEESTPPESATPKRGRQQRCHPLRGLQVGSAEPAPASCCSPPTDRSPIAAPCAGRTSAVRRQIRAHPIASSQLSVLQPLRKCEIL